MVGARPAHDAPQLPGWTARAFVDTEAAEHALSIVRAHFVTRNDIMSLIPIHVRKRLLHRGDTAQIEGFHQLFMLLNAAANTTQLRELVVDYFATNPPLRGQLRNSLSHPHNRHAIPLSAEFAESSRIGASLDEYTSQPRAHLTHESPILDPPGWTADVFINIHDAEVNLCADINSFVQRPDIILLIPRDIRILILHPGDIARIKGISELFTFLNTNPDAQHIRRLMLDYFENTPYLRGHLRSRSLSQA